MTSLGEEGVDGSNEKEKGLMNMDNSVVIVVQRGWVEVEESLSGINTNGKNTIKIINNNKWEKIVKLQPKNSIIK